MSRLQRVFQSIGRTAEGKTCGAMKALIAEGGEVIDADCDPDIKDAALIAAGQRVEHCEIAAYGTARTFAKRLGKQQAAQLLQETLDEETAADEKLTQLAESGVNAHAAMA